MKKSASTAMPTVYDRVQIILASARNHAARSVKPAQVVANWLIGREIVEEQQHGAKRAGYGEQIVSRLAGDLRNDGVAGYGEVTLRLCRQFYLHFPGLAVPQMCYALRNKSAGPAGRTGMGDALRKQSPLPAPGKSISPVPHLIETARATDWQPGQLHPALSWTHYRALLRISQPQARAFYEIESIKQNWNTRELERQLASLLYERLAKSRDKKSLLALATKGQQIQTPADGFKDPVVIEFLGLPESHRLVESKLEEALISNLQAFLLDPVLRQKG